jgi:hypothetical protein
MVKYNTSAAQLNVQVIRTHPKGPKERITSFPSMTCPVTSVVNGIIRCLTLKARLPGPLGT